MKLFLCAFFVLSSLLSTQVFANWILMPEQSNLSFVSIKKSSVGEVHHFQNLLGEVLETGEVNLIIDLKSVKTGIEIRDERMKQFLFAVTQFPTAKISTNIDEKVIGSMKVGAIKSLPVELNIDLHGAEVKKTAHLRVVKLSPDSIFVVTEKPLIINAKDFGMSEGVAKLQQLAGLPSIDDVVPVSFNAVFQKP